MLSDDDLQHLPVAFAQVREDARLDLAVLGQARATTSRRRVLMVASGGCTAVTLLALARPDRLVAVDVNPAQLDLLRIKQTLLGRPVRERRALLGHVRMTPKDRLAGLRRAGAEAGVRLESLGNSAWLAKRGLDFSGRYEGLFGELAAELARAGLLRSLLGAVPPPARNGAAADLRGAFAQVFAQKRLEALFGAAAAGNRRRPFVEHFLARLRLAQRRAGWRRNPFIRGFLGQPLPASAAHDWHTLEPQRPRTSVQLVLSDFSDFLRSTDERFDFIHLSNIADWLTPDQVRRLLEATASRLAPDGVFILRQLNSALDFPALCPKLRWDIARSRALARKDRSFFYPHVWTGGRR